jgi:WD40 repeat protein
MLNGRRGKRFIAIVCAFAIAIAIGSTFGLTTFAEERTSSSLANSASTSAPAPSIASVIRHLVLPRGATDVAWSPDGKLLATVGGLKQQIMLWNAGSGKLLWERSGNFGGVQALAFSNDGRLLLVSGAGSEAPDEDTALTLWSVASGKVVGGVPGPFPGEGAMANSARAIAIDRKRNLMAIVAFQDVDWPVAIYDMRSWSLVGKVAVAKDIPQTVAFGPDGTLAVGTVGGAVALFDARTRQLKRMIKTHFVYSLAFSPDAKYVAGGVGDAAEPIHIWRASDGALLRSYSFGHAAEVMGLAWSPNGRYLASAAFDSVVRLWPADAPGAPLVNIDIDAVSAAFSPGGAFLAAAGNGGAIIVRIKS